MFKYLRNISIDYELWDFCIGSSSNGMIYGLSWYLDIVSPNWDGIVNEVEGKYIAVIPVTKVKRFGITYIKQPLFTQQLGLFCLPGPLNKGESLTEILKMLNRRFFFMLPYSFNEDNFEPFPGDLKNIKCDKFINHVLELDRAYPEILKDYSRDRRYRLRGAQKENLIITEGDHIERLITMMDEQIASKIKGLKGNSHVFNILKAIHQNARNRNMCFLLEVKKDQNLVIASSLFLKFNKRLIYFCSAVTNEGRESNAMTLLIDSVIQKYQKTEYTLDFEGSPVVEISKFFRGFGAKEAPFPVIQKLNPLLTKPYIFIRKKLAGV